MLGLPERDIARVKSPWLAGDATSENTLVPPKDSHSALVAVKGSDFPLHPCQGLMLIAIHA